MASVGGLYGTFENNSAQFGGAISARGNSDIIQTGTLAFTGNTAVDGGGAIYITDNASISSYTANSFEDNKATGEGSMGGAVYNESGRLALSATRNSFKNNEAAYGGAIANKGTISGLNGTFENNKASKYGGAIYNTKNGVTISNVNFYNNTAEKGGAIYTTGDMTITGPAEFKDNKAVYEETNEATGEKATKTENNAIYMDKAGGILTLKTTGATRIAFYDSISGHKDGYTLKLTGSANTGTVSLYDEIKNASLDASKITVDFANGETRDYEFNKIKADSNTLFNIDVNLEDGTSDKIIQLTAPTASDGSSTIKLGYINFIGNKEEGNPVTIKVLDGETSNLKLAVSTDKMMTSSSIKDTAYSDQIITDDPSNAIKLSGTDSITVDGKFYSPLNVLASKSASNKTFNFRGGANLVKLTEDLDTISSGYMKIVGISGQNSTIDGNGHSLFNLDNNVNLTINDVTIQNAESVVEGTNEFATVKITNSNIINNKKGITTAGSIEISGNTTIQNNGNGINATSDNSVVTITASTNNVLIDDEITSANIVLKGGRAELKQHVNADNFKLENATAVFANESGINARNVEISSPSAMNFANGKIGNIQFNNLTLNSDLKLSIDADLAGAQMDTISANSLETPTSRASGKIDVSEITLTSDSVDSTTSILFADSNLKNSVISSVNEVAYSPIYKYAVSYNEEDGKFTFKRGESGSVDNYNPAVLSAPAAAQTGGFLVQLNSYDQAFANMESRMMIPRHIRQAMAKQNAVAISDGYDIYQLQGQAEYNDGWYRPYSTFENVNLRSGVKVSNIMYGSFFGTDSKIVQMKNGKEAQASMYIGYNGSHQNFMGNSMYQNGGTLGFTGTIYKGNLFTALTVNAGGASVQSSTIYGHDTFPMLMAGIASKSGFNIEMNDGRFIIQPSFMMSYSYVNTFDYTNAAGVRIGAEPLHAIQLSPGVKFLGTTQKGWQPYFNVAMKWNIMDKTNFSANNVSLPWFSIRPYVEYGVGVQKHFTENCGGYLQAMMRNGGRNGVALSGGFNWLIGRNKENI